MKTNQLPFAAIIILLTSLGGNVMANEPPVCATNNVYNEYNVPFSCTHKEKALTQSAADTINFVTSSATTQCTVVTTSPISVHLQYYTQCHQQFPTQISKQLLSSAGQYSFSFNTDCYNDAANNQANIYITDVDDKLSHKAIVKCDPV